MVSNAIDPGAHGASSVVLSEAAPDLKMDLLHQIATLVWIEFVGAGQTLQRRAKLSRCGAVEIVLACSHTQGSLGRARFLTKNFRV